MDIEKVQYVAPVFFGYPDTNFGGPGYDTIPGYRAQEGDAGEQGRVTFRFRPTLDQIADMAAGHDIMLTVLTFGKPLTPMLMWTCPDAAGVLDEGHTKEVCR